MILLVDIEEYIDNLWIEGRYVSQVIKKFYRGG